MIEKLLNMIKPRPSSERELYLFLKSTLGISPSNIKIYKQAFIHKSLGLKDSMGFTVNNERLEFLGDAILDSVIADYLYKRFPNKDEGYLTQIRSRLVSRTTLTKVATAMNLGHLIEAAPNSFSDGNQQLGGDVFEALIGAIYLDRGYRAVRKVMVNKILNTYIDISDVEQNNTNYKSRIIEWGQKSKKSVSFSTYDISDSENSSLKFGTKITIDNQLVGKGRGFSKKESQQNAAKIAIAKLFEE